ncbi:MAG: hypothetical protein RIS76_2910, partial [Verrucomicrobiota bacterium]
MTIECQAQNTDRPTRDPFAAASAIFPTSPGSPEVYAAAPLAAKNERM